MAALQHSTSKNKPIRQVTISSHSYLRDWFEVTTCGIVCYCVYDMPAATS